MIKNLLLDLDGTLIDSSTGIYHSFSLACDQCSLLPPCYPVFCNLIGPPVQEIALKLYPGIDSDLLYKFRSIFREDYDNGSYRKVQWYPGVINTIKLIASEFAVDMCIITNKPTKPARNLVASADLDSCFSQVVGIDYFADTLSGHVFPSKTEAISYVLSSRHFTLLQSVYVGDTVGDMKSCGLCNLPFIAALYGFHRWRSHEMPDRCLNHFGDIKTFLR